MKIILASSLFCFPYISMYPQTSIDSYSIKNESGRVVIYATNNEYCDYYFTINFTRLDNLKPSRESPYSKTISKGNNRILTLTPIDKEDYTYYNYRFTAIKGRYNKNVNDSAVYLLPFKAGTSCIIASSYLPDRRDRVFVADIDYHNFEVIIFNLSRNDTVYASRSGYICKIDYLDEEKQNEFIEIFHSDGTFAYYGGIKNNLVSIGDFVYAGDPIAVIGDYNKHRLDFNIYYLDSSKLDNQIKSPYSTFYPLFLTKNNSVTKLRTANKYTSHHPIEFITRGMSKREKKKYFKNKRNNN